ncbi:hypothetical protein C8R47DRAFT_1215699 [Mycena vitilis]|nr:hypothetical protein C8R47DRAFT_1215699 [Mycena vitilis]
MDYLPPRSNHLIPRRGKAVLLDASLLDIIDQELENSDRRFAMEAPFRTAWYTMRDATPAPSEPDSATETSAHSDNDSNDATDLDTIGPPATSSEPDTEMVTGGTESDSENINNTISPFPFDPTPWPSAEWSEGFINHFSPYPLHRRPLSPPQEDSPAAFSDVLSVAHLEMMGFKKIGWDDPRAFVDLHDRIGAFFIGPPRERTRWENTIMAATDVLRQVGATLDPLDDNTLRGGFKHSPNGVERPQNFTNTDANLVALAVLRHSEPIQEITSFQNAMLEQLAPELWACANQAIDAVMRHDVALRLPFHQCLGQPDQPTAFAQVEYAFAIDDSHPKQHLRDRATGWTAVTSVGDYAADESALILWREHRIIRFPPGSTFLFPAGLLNYSFTGISEYSSRMLISQTFDGEIWRFIEGGMSLRPQPSRLITSEDWAAYRRERATKAIEMFPTLNGYDHDTGYA